MREAPAWIPVLKNHPSEWALVQIYDGDSAVAAYARAQNIRAGLSHCYQPPGAFDSTVRKIDGEYHLFAAYVPDTEATSAQ